MRRKQLWYGFLFLAWLLPATSALTDDIQPTLLEITNPQHGEYTLQWRKPMPPDRAAQLKLDIESGGRWLSYEMVMQTEQITIERLRLELAPNIALEDLRLRIEGLERVPSTTIVRVIHPDSVTTMQTFAPREAAITFETNASAATSALAYLTFGVKHILMGLDHLLFVLMLLLLQTGWRALFWTITSFTLAHSLTLSAAALNWINVPGPPTEALIALSIMLLAAAVLTQQREQTEQPMKKSPSSLSFSPRHAAFIMGLLHGLGFASVLVEVGLPENEKLLALALFNIGVEIGQLAFVLSVVVLWLSCRWLFNYRVNMLRATAAYGSGAIAAFWFFDRVAQF
jgi:hydrogenase/urease accessory protein HupE